MEIKGTTLVANLDITQVCNSFRLQ